MISFEEAYKNTTLWCDGLSAGSQKSKHESDDESDDDQHLTKKSQSKKRDVNMEQVQDLVEELKAKHGASTFTQMVLMSPIIIILCFLELEMELVRRKVHHLWSKL